MYKGRERRKELQAYARPAMYPADFDVLDSLAKGARMSKPEMLAFALKALIRDDETPFEAGERLTKELA